MENLPVWERKEEFLRAFKENQMVMLTGETGSGKTTQIPQFVLEALMDENPTRSDDDDQCLVGCTQPHRVAAMSAARRVAEEMNVEIGEEVGYTVRFDEDRSSPRTVLKYLTDVMLLKEAMVDPLFSRYKVIILDQVHERSLATDLLVGILLNRTLISARPDLKLVVMSATLQPFNRDCFRGAPLIKVPSGTLLHPVEILYTPEILRSNLVNTVLTLKRLGVNDLTSFEYIDPPCPEMLLMALFDLFHLGAVDDQGNLTDIGHMMETWEEPL